MKLRPAQLLPRGNANLTAARVFAQPKTIRARLRRILIFSVVLMLALLTVIITREVERYRDTGSTANAVDLALAAQDLVHEVQRERGLTNGLLGGDESAREPVKAQRAATDSALLALNAVMADDIPGVEQMHAALRQLSGITANRADVDARRLERSVSFNFYTSAIQAVNQARPGLENARDSVLWRGLQTLYALGEVKEFTAQERGFLNGVFVAGGFGNGEYVRFLDIRAGKQAAITTFERDATSAQRSQLYEAMRSEESVRVAESESIAIGSVRGPLLEPVNPADWWRQMTSVIDAERGVQRVVGTEIHDRAAELRKDAALVLAAYALVALLAVAAMVWLVVATVRAIVQPLAELAEEAEEVATNRLPHLIAAWHRDAEGDPDPPEPVHAHERAGEEITSVAKALDRVQTTAFELASAQARLRRNTTESLANLARRNQNLVRRQLGLISEFEREELDPNALSNLFELDHLATRMRRNAESLLVLVGESSPRRWSQSIPLSDVIRAGLSEVDDYRRVVLRRVDDAAINGSSVSELAHMLAELIENGLAFSPPDLEVEIYGRRQGSRYLIAIVDHGVGMPPDQLVTANARLAGAADFLVAPTRFLGHFVVGRLAQRLGVQVELTVSPVSGVVARLLLPETLLNDQRGPQPEPTTESKHAAAPAHTDDAAAAMADPVLGRHRSGQPMTAAISSEISTRPAPRPVNGAPRVPADEATGLPLGSTAIRLIPFDSPIDAPIAPAATTAGPERRIASTAPAGQSLPGGRGIEHTRPDAAARSGADFGVDVSPNAQPAAPGVTGTVPGVQRTRNGLVKRNRKTREHSGVAPSGAQPTTGGPTTAPPTERSPDAVRSMLTGFRAGHQRGESGVPPRPGSNPQEDPR